MWCGTLLYGQNRPWRATPAQQHSNVSAVLIFRRARRLAFLQTRLATVRFSDGRRLDFYFVRTFRLATLPPFCFQRRTRRRQVSHTSDGTE